MEEGCVGFDGGVGEGIVFNLQGSECVSVGEISLKKIVEESGFQEFLCASCGGVIDGDVSCVVGEAGISFLCGECEKTY